MNKEVFSFELLAQNEKSRVGKINTPRGIINTPAFMPVGTLGTVKGIFLDDLPSFGKVNNCKFFSEVFLEII